DLRRPAAILRVQPERGPEPAPLRRLHADLVHAILAAPARAQHAALDVAGRGGGARAARLGAHARGERQTVRSEDVVVGVAIAAPLVVQVVELAPGVDVAREELRAQGLLVADRAAEVPVLDQAVAGLGD